MITHSVRRTLSKDCFRVAWLMCLPVSLWLASPLLGEEKPKARPEAIRPISGSLVIVGGGIIPPEVTTRFLELGGGENARLVVVTTASVFASDEREMNLRLETWRTQKTASFRVLHTNSREEANDPEFTRPLEDATAVWFVGGNQNSITDAYLGTLTEEKFHEVIQRGGVIGGTSAGAAIMSRVMIGGSQLGADGHHLVMIKTGLGFAPGLIVDQHFRKRNRQERLLEALNQCPGNVGMGIDEGTALIIRGAKAEVLGVSDVTIALGAGAGKPSKMESLQSGKSADLAALSRAAISRMPAADVAALHQPPKAAKGTLMLVGRGIAPDEVRDQFLEAAGGKDAAIVVVSAIDEEDGAELEICEWLRSAGASNVKALAARNRQEIESPEFVASLKNATGIWLSNGPLRRLVDAYVDTPVQELLEGLLERGGVVAGSAAGATLSGMALPTTAEENESEVISEAYERGFGFLPGVVVVSHKTEPVEAGDLTGLNVKYPQLMGVELSDSTALIVRGSSMQVLGKNSVTVLAPHPENSNDARELSRVSPGETYSFSDRKRSAANGD